MDADGARAGVAAPPGAMQPPALELVGLVKRFGETTAVDHIDLRVPRGSFFGLVGPNGAGKTTTLSMAVGLLRPDGGSARIFGIDVWADPVAAKQLVGVLPDGGPCPSGSPAGNCSATWASCGAWTGPPSPPEPRSCWRCWS